MLIVARRFLHISITFEDNKTISLKDLAIGHENRDNYKFDWKYPYIVGFYTFLYTVRRKIPRSLRFMCNGANQKSLALDYCASRPFMNADMCAAVFILCIKLGKYRGRQIVEKLRLKTRRHKLDRKAARAGALFDACNRFLAHIDATYDVVCYTDYKADGVSVNKLFTLFVEWAANNAYIVKLFFSKNSDRGAKPFVKYMLWYSFILRSPNAKTLLLSEK